jgi:hypothetical protein
LALPAIGRILVNDAGEYGADWFISAQGAPELIALLKKIWRCGTLSASLYGYDDVADNVLKQMREPTRLK